MEKQPLVVLFASAIPEEGTQFQTLLAHQGESMVVHSPSNLNEIENLLKESGVDVIVTDLEFQNGAFADWLFLWPFPFVLLADYANRERINAIIQDSACSFLIREKDRKHLEVLPILIRKVFQEHQLRKRQNLEVLIREQKYLDLVQALPDVVYSLDEEGYFTFVNDAVREFGFEPIELVGKHFSVLLEPDEVPRVSRKLVLQQYQGKVTGPEKAPKLFDER
ncbi:MAG: PAS domain-containing protein, partial [Spirochaetales bacterium]